MGDGVKESSSGRVYLFIVLDSIEGSSVTLLLIFDRGRKLYWCVFSGWLETLLSNTFDFNKFVNLAIGHVRYSTSGSKSNYDVIQPRTSLKKSFSLVHNGNIPNIKGHDTSYINNLLMNLNHLGNIENRLIHILQNIPAAYSIVILLNNVMYIMRDRYGIRPLCIGQKDNNYYVSSESIAFNNEINKGHSEEGSAFTILPPIVP